LNLRDRHSIVTYRTSTIGSAQTIVDPDATHMAFIKRVIFSATGAAGVLTLTYAAGATTLDVLRVRDGDTIDPDNLRWPCGVFGDIVKATIASGPSAANLTVEYWLREKT
jgi:hypothetical protein